MSHSLKGHVLPALGAATLAAAFAGGFAATAHAADKLVVSLDTPPTHYRTEIMKDFLEELESASGGSLKSELFHSSQLYGVGDVARAVARGDVGLSVVASPFLSSVVPDIGVLDLPVMNGLTSDQRDAMIDGELGQTLSDELSDTLGVVVPGDWWQIGKIVYFASEPLTNFGEFEGQQIRIPGAPAVVARVEAYGATGVPMPFTDTPLALQQGVITAVLATPDSIISNGLTDAGVEYAFWDYGIIGHSAPLVSRSYWDSLTEDEQALFTSTWNEFTARQRMAVAENETSDRAALEDVGVTWTDASEADVDAANAALMAIQDELAKKLGISEEIVAVAEAARK